jgi:hypothetical protein
MADQRIPEKGSGALIVLGWLTTALGVPALAGAVEHQWVAKHSTLSIVLGVVIAVIIGMAGLARQIWLERYKDPLIDWVGAGIERRTGLFWQRYREHLLADLRYVDLRGLAGRFFDPDLSDVYVDVALRPRDPGKVASSDLPDADLANLPMAGQRGRIEDFLGRPQPRVLAVIGAPGSGKTTLLRHTACQMCMTRRGHRQGRSIPVLLYLRDHVTRIVAEPQVALPALVAEDIALHGLSDRAGWLEQRLRAGDCIVMLDGLDEVARLEDRRAVAEWVRMQVIRYSGNDFVVTSRPLGYQNSPIEGALTLQAQPFTRGQVTQFIQRWCLAEERRSTGAFDETIIRKAEVEADDLATRLQAAPALRALTVSPLLLTMIAIVHRHYGALPGSRAELYARICQVLLWSRQDAKKLKVEPRGDQKERLMRILAFEMMCRKVRDLSTTEAAAILRPVLDRMAKGPSVHEVLYDAASNGLFIERENGVRAFAHQTFQEYLTAAYIKDKSLQGILVDAVSDVWWRETTLLYVAGADAGPIVESCLATNTLPALTLAFDCKEEASELAPDLRDKLNRILAEGLAPGADPDRRRPATGVTLSRHLRQVTETADGTRVCSQPITIGIYRLFLEDMQARGQSRPPDAPTDLGLTGAEEVIMGMRGSDAMAFVDWANEITGGPPAYRLPTLDELEDPSVRDIFAGRSGSPPHSVWVAPDPHKEVPRLYSPDNASPAGTINGAKLRKQLDADFVGAPLALGILPLMVHAYVAARVRDDRRHDGIPHAIAGTLDFLRNLADALGQGQAHDLSRSLEAGLADLVRHDLDDARTALRDVDRKLKYDGRAVLIYVDLIVARTVKHDLGLLSAFARTLLNDRVRAYALGIAVDTAGKVEQSDLELVLNLELLRSLESTHCADISLDRDIDSDSVCYLDQLSGLIENTSDANSPDRVGKLQRLVDSFLARLSRRILGCALSETVSGPPDDDEPYPDLSEAAANIAIHAGRFADVVGLRPADYEMPPDALPDTVHSAITALDAQLSKGEHPEWARLVASRFASLIEGVLVREQQVEASIGLSLRIMALCLAAEADAVAAQGLGHEFRRIAAGLTWLELRHSGAEPALGTIVLALN